MHLKDVRRQDGPLRRLICVSLVITLSACASSIGDSHYFGAFDEKQSGHREPVQFYRVTVKGGTHFTNARYVTGYFDERAVSLFFNEMKRKDDGILFQQNQTLPGTDTKLTPLDASTGEGTFVLIMSTNADTIAATIGSFAESQVVADAFTNMLNRDRIKQKVRGDALVAVNKAEAQSVVDMVNAQVTAAGNASSGAKAAASYVRALTALARSLGYAGEDFANGADAQAWFNTEARNAERSAP